MKKFLFFLIFFLTLFIFSGILLLNFALEKGSYMALDQIAAEGASRGIKVELARFEEVGLSALGVVTWKGLVMVISAHKYIALSPGEDVVLSVGEIHLDLKRLLQGVAAITADGIGARVKRSATSTEGMNMQAEGIHQGQLKVAMPLDMKNKDRFIASVLETPQKALQFLQEGKTTVPFGFRGKSVFQIGGSVVEADITTKLRGNSYFLVMSPDGLRKIAAKLKAELTEAEIQLLSLSPLLAPAIFKVTSYARTQAELAYAKDATVPEDAYRHVLWSYRLTREFGPEFAKKLTDAHEIGSVRFNTEADHQMDYNNNRVGQEYLKAGHTEGMLLQLVKTDPQVIRVAGQPRSVPRR